MELNGDIPAIHVREGAEYPLYYFNRDDNRRFLCWVLMDPDARKSFDSISTNLFINKYRQENYDHWDFRFSPPPLTGVELKVSGWDDFASNTFLVWEVTDLAGLPSSVTGEVDIIHPNFERKVGGKPIKGDGGLSEAPEEYGLDDDEMSDTDKATVELMSETVSVSFKDPFITNRISGKTRSVSNIITTADKEELVKDLSVNEKEITGDLPGGAWNNLDDQTDDGHLYLRKFQSFIDMVTILESSHGCIISNKTTKKLPKRGSGKKICTGC